MRSAAAVSAVQCIVICRSDSAEQSAEVTCTGVARGRQASSISQGGQQKQKRVGGDTKPLRPAVKAAQRSAAQRRATPAACVRADDDVSAERAALSADACIAMHRNASRCNGERTVCAENVRHPPDASVHPPCRTQQRARQGTAKNYEV